MKTFLFFLPICAVPIEGFSVNLHRILHTGGSTSPPSCEIARSGRCHCHPLLATKDDDDGWGEEDNVNPSNISNAPRSSAQESELAALRFQMETKTKQASVNDNRRVEEPERDLFIPIFAVVSLAGLFGAYGYEMLRLNSRGELYLPWNQ